MRLSYSSPSTLCVLPLSRRISAYFPVSHKDKIPHKGQEKKKLLSTVNILLDNDSLFIHSVVAAVKALGFLKGGMEVKRGSC